MLAKTIRLLLACAATFYLQLSIAQYSAPMQTTAGSSGFSIYLGGNTFLGDLGGKKGAGAPFIKDFNSKTIRPYLGVAYTYFPYSWLSLNGGFHYTWVTGADSLITQKVGHAAGRFDRNLSFKSAISELSVEAEWYPIQMLPDHDEARLRPFVGSGIGVFHFNPKAQLNGKWINLQPLHLEGQGFAEYPERKEYKLNQVYIPISLGLKYRINNNYFVSLSTIFRRTFTDYIDDVSTTYIDPTLFDKYLSPAKASLAKQLFFRGLTPETTNLYRGYGSEDSYTSIFFTLTYIFDTRDISRFVVY